MVATQVSRLWLKIKPESIFFTGDVFFLNACPNINSPPAVPDDDVLLFCQWSFITQEGRK